MYRDPVTGDPISFADWLSLKMMGFIRSMAFLVLWMGYTAWAWQQGKIQDADPLTTWNLIASALAIVVEQVVGRTVYGQSRRDALVLRRDELMLQHIEELLEHKRAQEREDNES